MVVVTGRGSGTGSGSYVTYWKLYSSTLKLSGLLQSQVKPQPYSSLTAESETFFTNLFSGLLFSK